MHVEQLVFAVVRPQIRK